MADRGIGRFPADPEAGDDSLLNLARAIWQARWLVVGCLMAGAVLGVWYESGQPRFRTTTTIRWLSPNISYLYSSYWEITSKVRAGQLRAMIGNHPQASRIALRTDKDSWIARLEVLHDTPGAGEKVGEEILQALQKLDEQTAATHQSSSDTPDSLQKLQQTLTELEALLATIPEDRTSAESAVRDDPVTRLNQQFTSEAGPRLPLENLPLFPWYRSLQVRTSRILAAAAAAGTKLSPISLERLIALQQFSTAQLLECWWSFDVLVSAGPLPRFNVESISEQPEASSRRQLQAALLGLWLAGGAAVMFAVPLRWLRLHWRSVIAAETAGQP
jgi:hypothetical protein